MGGDPAGVAEQAAWSAAGRRLAGSEHGIFWRLRSGAPWADIPEHYGLYTTCYNRFVRWRKAGVWDRLMHAITKAYDGDIQTIDSSSVRVHQHAANGKRGVEMIAWVVRAAG